MELLNAIRIAFKDLKAFRDVKMLIFMLATPIIVILVLGTALTNVFNESITVGEIRVLYHMNNADPALVDSWKSLEQKMRESGVLLEEVGSHMDESQEVERGRYTGYVVVTDRGIDYFGNSRTSIENSIVIGILTSFADRYKLTMVMPDVALSSSGIDYVHETKLQAAKQPGALDYYAIAITTMVILYTALPAAQLIEIERTQKTDIRLMASPVTRTEIFTGKILGHLLLQLLFILIIIFISKFMFNAYWGENIGLVILVLASQIVFALSLGLGASYLMKGNAAIAVIMMIVQLESLIGGAYFPVDGLKGFMGLISSYSPLRSTNDAVFKIIYAEQLSSALPTILLNLGFGALLLIMSVTMMRRREGL